jgi:hypothetical protein
MDRAWWQMFHAEVSTSFPGERTSRAPMNPRMRVTCLQRLQHYNNSGAAAVSLAAERGATRVILLGYDCQRTNNQAHWHGDHPKGLGNAGSMQKWAAGFAELAENMRKKGVEVINCSRATALTVFPRSDLESELAKTAPE